MSSRLNLVLAPEGRRSVAFGSNSTRVGSKVVTNDLVDGDRGTQGR
ncbi:MAG TPA: hypothetical protein VI485_21370 [Vicinamibacterales bacterium]|nr:hypothetical protein [Vicinamibacterales bacterium]